MKFPLPCVAFFALLVETRGLRSIKSKALPLNPISLSLPTRPLHAWAKQLGRRRTGRPAGRSTRVRSTDKLQEASSESDASPAEDDFYMNLQQLLDTKGASRQASEMVSQHSSRRILTQFGNAILLPRREYSEYEMKMFRVDPNVILSPEDQTLQDFSRNSVFAVASLYVLALTRDFEHWFEFGLLVLFIAFADQIAFSGGAFALAVDTLANVLNKQYQKRVSIHEAGHLLTAYLVGVLPQRYRLSSLEAFQNDGLLNVQAGTVMADSAMKAESSESHPAVLTSPLEKYATISLAGIAAEYVVFERAEGGESDLILLDQILRASGMTRRECVLTKRWAALAVVCLLREKRPLLLQLAKAMRNRTSVAECMRIIEAYHRSEQK
eukprot:CAMPEP_0184482638 /NCGR_PEP_ID=MMETSP0113_2-20130426/4210_1 /TAXON_ID=91329 /ORGANISM="Norrisiella sphaerica, Strain BC52" /LENGTH=381 /DNA_ID=CAMNT_0026862489 /DNA_START=170 /DNA_END=1315 /DNA_ORIENTATION=+